MKGGPELGLTSAVAGGAIASRSAEGSAAKGPRGSSPFEALLAEIRPHSQEKGARGTKGGAARVLAGPLGADAHKPRLNGTDGDKAEAAPDAADGPAIPAEHVTLDAGPQGQSLAQAVAVRIAASLGDAPASTPGEPERPADASWGRREAIATTLAVAVSASRRADPGTAHAGAVPDLAVTRRETHFGPVLSAATSSDRGAAEPSPADGDSMQTAPGSSGSRVDSDLMTSPRGRAEQMMMAGRTAPAGGRAAQGQALGATPGAILRTAAAEARPAGADATGADALEGTVLQGGTPSGAPGAARVSGAAPTLAGPAAPPAAPTMFAGGVGPVKVLHIHLQPAELGALEVRMRLTDAGLEVHIEATRQETLTLLKNDREALAHVLRGTGHSVDAVTVSLADKSAAQGQAGQDGWQPPSSGRPDGQSGARDQGGRPDERFPSRPDGGPAFDKVHDDQDQPALAARHGDLYL